MTEHLGDDLSPKPDPILGPSFSSQSSAQPGCVVRAPKQGPKPQEVPPALWGCSKPSWMCSTQRWLPGRFLLPSYQPEFWPLQSPHPRPALCLALGSVLCKHSGRRSILPIHRGSCVAWLGPAESLGSLLLAALSLLNGRDPCRHALCCHGSPAVNEPL